ncbi:MAG TPA: hypothetical protein VNC17_13985 [Thermoleophilaceae bacterium]|jgi:hypothetical protein|nr:hypothetical protein [Thermoleophilaceae bacterium]
MPQPRIKRYALVPDGDGRGTRRFHLARVASASRSALGADRLERMEEIAGRDRGRQNGSKPRPSDD